MAKTKLEELTAQKMAAGLSKDDALECAQRQLDHEDALAEAEKAKAKKTGGKPEKGTDAAS